MLDLHCGAPFVAKSLFYSGAPYFTPTELHAIIPALPAYNHTYTFSFGIAILTSLYFFHEILIPVSLIFHCTLYMHLVQ